MMTCSSNTENCPPPPVGEFALALHGVIVFFSGAFPFPEVQVSVRFLRFPEEGAKTQTKNSPAAGCKTPKKKCSPAASYPHFFRLRRACSVVSLGRFAPQISWERPNFLRENCKIARKKNTIIPLFFFSAKSQMPCHRLLLWNRKFSFFRDFRKFRLQHAIRLQQGHTYWLPMF